MSTSHKWHIRQSTPENVSKLLLHAQLLFSHCEASIHTGQINKESYLKILKAQLCCSAHTHSLGITYHIAPVSIIHLFSC